MVNEEIYTWLLCTFSEKRRKMLDALFNSHPKPMNIKHIASKGKINVKTAYGADYLRRLITDGYVKEVDEGEETGGYNEFVFENVNSLRDSSNKYSLAPGNVEYTNEFKSALDRLVKHSEIRNQFRILLRFVRHITECQKEPNEEQIVPKNDSRSLCSLCGLNHEARDFIRAILLYLIDQFERSSDYLEFLKEKRYIDMRHYNKYCKLIPTDSEKGKSAEIITQSQSPSSETNEERLEAEAITHKAPKTEKQITHPKTDDERIAEAWFEKLKTPKPLVRRMIEVILSEKPGMPKVQIMNLIQDRMSETKSKSELDAAKWIIDSLGIFLPLELLIAYKSRKNQTAHEQGPGVHELRLERQRKRRAKRRQSSN